MTQRQAPRPTGKPCRFRSVKMTKRGPVAAGSVRRSTGTKMDRVEAGTQTPAGGRTEAHGEEDRCAEAPGRCRRFCDGSTNEANRHRGGNGKWGADRKRCNPRHSAAFAER